MTSLNTHFKTMMVTDTSQEPPEEIEVSEFISPGQLLVSLPERDTKRSERIEPLVGDNTQMTPDQTGIIATCHGYPSVLLSSTDRGPIAIVSVSPLLQIADNLMEAQILLHPPVPPAEPIILQSLLDILAEAGIHYGIDTAAISKGLQQTAESGLPVTCIAARGRIPLRGKDAVLRFEVEIGPSPGKLLGNGTIDFRERAMFVAVSENQILARKIPATPGTPGMNLAGKVLAAQDGQDMQVKVSEETSYCQEDSTIRATASGVLTMVNNDTIRVSAQQRINGNVDYSTGNIRSQNAVHVVGSILPEFMVSTKGDLLVGGNIQSATVNSLGNIVVKGGILGPSSNIHVQGDADINYIERSLLNAGGNIVIRASGYYSTIVAAGNIQCPDKVKIVGGNVVAGGSITVGQLGSNAAEPIRVAVGTDPRRYRRYQEMQKTYQQALSEIQNWYNHHGRTKTNSRVEAMVERLSQIERELSKCNLIPDTPEDSLGNHDYFYTKAQIKVAGRVSSGTRIRIGNDVTVITRELNRTRICMDPVSGAIVFLSF